MKTKKQVKIHSRQIASLAKKFLILLGELIGHSPVWVKKLLAKTSRLLSFNDTLARWNNFFMDRVFCNETKPIFLQKRSFSFFGQKINCSMNLNLSDDLQRNYYFLNYGPDLLKIIKDRLTADSVFIDVGANIGYFSMIAGSIIKDGRIISFEPEFKNYGILESNAAGTAIEPHRLALSNKTGTAKLYVGMGSSGWHSFKGRGKYEQVSTKRLDDLGLGLKKIDLIKIDVERHEMEALIGMRKTLAKFSPDVFCEVDKSTEQKVTEFMSKLGYSPKKFPGPNTYDILFTKKAKIK